MVDMHVLGYIFAFPSPSHTQDGYYHKSVPSSSHTKDAYYHRSPSTNVLSNYKYMGTHHLSGVQNSANSVYIGISM